MPAKPFFVVNPHSADGRTQRLWQELRPLLEGRFGAVPFALTRGTMHAAELSAQAIEAGAELVVAVGGDGTLNEVLNGFFRAGRQPPAGAVLGYLPSGTGSDFARTMGLYGLPLAEQVEKLAAGTVRLLDCGQVRFTGAGPGGQALETSRLFLNESSLGFSAETVNNVNRASKRFGGKASFFLGVLRTLVRLRNPLLQVTVDGKPVYEGPTLLVAVANGRYFGGSMMIAPMADVQDGEFDVVVVSAMSRRTVLKKIGKIYRGEHLAEPEVHVHRGAEVRISSVGEEVLLEMDGEQPGRLAADFRISRHTVPFLA
jgi:YegS/Rv2252/BmrU family lipid kinase